MNSPLAFTSQSFTRSETVAEWILDQVASLRASSLIRLGDGEGALLSGMDENRRALSAYLHTHFGEAADEKRLAVLRRRLLQVVESADVIGIRQDVLASVYPADLGALDADARLDWARRHLPLRPEERNILSAEDALRLILLGRWMTNFDWPSGTLLASAWIHFDWLESGFLTNLAVRQAPIGLVTGRPELAPLFRSAGVEVDEWLVPLRYLRRGVNWTPHFPDRFDELVDTLEPAYPGQLFFVGAGICGKVYCDVIAQRGGIALDIGAVCDVWLGISSRPRVARFRWGQDEVPTRFLLRNQLNAARSSNEEACHGPH